MKDLENGRIKISGGVLFDLLRWQIFEKRDWEWVVFKLPRRLRSLAAPSQRRQAPKAQKNHTCRDFAPNMPEEVRFLPSVTPAAGLRREVETRA